jgi:hypothetical protein
MSTLLSFFKVQITIVKDRSNDRYIIRQIEIFKSSHTIVYTNTFIVDLISLQNTLNSLNTTLCCRLYELYLYLSSSAVPKYLHF